MPARAPRRYRFDSLLRELARAPEITSAREPSPPRKLGRYLLGSLVGRGGMGAVYRARDLELGREVAIKRLQAQRGSIGLVRFTREVRALALLSHPNVVAIYDAAVSRGTAYLVMELVAGETLRQLLLRELKLALPHALQFAREIAEALAAAHAHGIVHRGLRPENVIVTAQGRIKVLDFGLAQLSALGTEQTDRGATMTAALLGTAHYMSPEQVRGQRVTPRSDVFAFGALLYEMLLGRKAFGAASAAESYARILHGLPEGLTTAAPLTPRGQLLAVAQHCLQKEPRDRYASGVELVAALTAAAGKRSLERRTPARAESGKLPGRRRSTRYADAGGVQLAYQVIGDGPVDLCFVSGFVSNVDLWWEHALGRAFFGALAARTRLIMFDKRGVGLSDRVPNQTLEGRVADLRAVLDAAGSKQTVLFGDAGATCIRFAARFPERTQGLVLYGTTQQSWVTDLRLRELLVNRWGTGVLLPLVAPSFAADPSMLRWLARLERLSVSPGSLLALLDAIVDVDVTQDARALATPTLVIHRRGDKAHPLERGRALAELIPGARYSEHDGEDHVPMSGDSQRIVRELLEFVEQLPEPTLRVARGAPRIEATIAVESPAAGGTPALKA